MNSPLFQATKQQEYCPQCGGLLQLKQGKKGLFLGCSHYPECDYLKPLQQHESKTLKELPENCPECGNVLLLRQGHFGMFIGCSHYPECHFIVHDQPETVAQEIPCPDCQKGLLVARRGRQGKTFYGCNQFPHCKFTLAQRPELQACPVCAYPLSFLKNSEKNQRTFQCANKACKHIFNS